MRSRVAVLLIGVVSLVACHQLFSHRPGSAPGVSDSATDRPGTRDQASTLDLARRPDVPADQDFEPAKRDTSVEDDLIAQKDTGTGKKELGASKKDLSAAKKDLSAVKKDLGAAKKEMTVIQLDLGPCVSCQDRGLTECCPCPNPICAPKGGACPMVVCEQ